MRHLIRIYIFARQPCWSAGLKNYFLQMIPLFFLCCILKSVVSKGGVQKDNVVGLGFDATCSLVVMDTDGKPLSISPTGNP